jgi:nucleotidyltransferase substrate binding protein (TIGR01987 family)
MEKNMIEYDKFQKSLKHLEIMYEYYKVMDNSVPDLLKEAVPESIIQRFETCFDCMWKVLKRYLFEEMGLAEIPNSPKPLLRIANENNILDTDIKRWFYYLQLRNSTSHDYNGEKAKKALQSMDDYIADAIRLYEKMSGVTWH